MRCTTLANRQPETRVLSRHSCCPALRSLPFPLHPQLSFAKDEAASALANARQARAAQSAAEAARSAAELRADATQATLTAERRDAEEMRSRYLASMIAARELLLTSGVPLDHRIDAYIAWEDARAASASANGGKGAGAGGAAGGEMLGMRAVLQTGLHRLTSATHALDTRASTKLTSLQNQLERLATKLRLAEVAVARTRYRQRKQAEVYALMLRGELTEARMQRFRGEHAAAEAANAQASAAVLRDAGAAGHPVAHAGAEAAIDPQIVATFRSLVDAVQWGPSLAALDPHTLPRWV